MITQKSPSDTTIYHPAFLRGESQLNDIINKISNFVENIRIKTASKHGSPCSRKADNGKREERRSILDRKDPVRDEHNCGHYSKDNRETKNRVEPGTSRAKAGAEQILIDAEQLKAKLQL